MSAAQGSTPEGRIARAMQIAAEYRQRCREGTPASLNALLAAHPDLRDALVGLLADDTQDSPAPGAAAAPLPSSQPALRTIGPYSVLGTLGQGGMGTVYLVEQTSPVRRRLALKVIRLGMDSSGVLARFERERQTLAGMSHDAIAKVFDAGSTESGQPYFAMELVENGHPLTTYCDAEGLDLRERIALFDQVCQGVQHAHQKGVVHRDLKPSNVLAAGTGGKHRVKIIDFGIARATTPAEGDAMLTTGSGLVLGTPDYMAPEQCRGDPLLIDTRTDVYSLGVMLYELLCGELPLPGLRKLAIADLVRCLLHEEPAKPSTRLASLSPEANEHAQHRGTGVRTLCRELRGDLDWIVLKALAKEPERRYQTVHDLALDLGRYLAREPVSAGPPTAGYRVRKFIQRHRVWVLAAASVLVTALVGAGVAMGYAVEARAQATRASVAAAGNTVLTARTAANDGRWEDALSHFEQARALGHADTVELDLGRYEALEALGRTAESAALLGTLVPRAGEGPHAAKIALLHGCALMDEDRNQAFALIQQAQAVDQAGTAPLDPADREFAAAMLATDFDAIHDHLRSALVHNRRHGPSLDTLTAVLWFRGEPASMLRLADDHALLLPQAPTPVWARVFALAAMGRADEARQRIKLLRDSTHADILPFLSLVADLYEMVERRTDARLRARALAIPVAWPERMRIPLPPTAEEATEDVGDLVKVLLPVAIRLTAALAKLDVADDDQGNIRLPLHPWFLDKYSKERLLRCVGHVLKGEPIPEGEGPEEALLVIGREYATGRRTARRPLRGVTAGLPAVQRSDAMLAICLPADGAERAAAIEAALALPLSEEELRAYALMTVNLDLPNCWSLADRITVRWAAIHGETTWWRLLRAEVQLARGARDEARDLVGRTKSSPEDAAWIDSLRRRLS